MSRGWNVVDGKQAEDIVKSHVAMTLGRMALVTLGSIAAQRPPKKDIGRTTIQATLACFTKRAKCMTLSILETSLPRQRSHASLAFSIKAKNRCTVASLEGLLARVF